MKPFHPRLLRAVPAARRPVALLAALGIASGVATIATAFAITAIVVAVVRSEPLTTPVAWLTGLFLARAALAWATERAAAWAGISVSTALRSALVRRWGTVGADERPEPGAAVSLATSGASAIEPYAARYLPTLVTAAVVPALAIVTLVFVDWASALVVVLTLPLLPVFAALIGRTTERDTQRRWASLSQLSGHFLDVVRGLPTLVGYGRAERQVQVVAEVSQRHRRATMKTLRLAFLSSASLELLASISVAIVAVLVGLRLANGSVDLTTGMLAILLAPEAYWPVRRVGQEFHTAADGAVALDEIIAELERPEGASVAAGRPAEVVVSGITYAYAADLAPVITDLSFLAGPGLTVVTGPSGTGKSTLLDLVAGLRTPQTGTVAAPALHYVTQRPFLAAGTVRDNLTLGRTAPGEAASGSASGPERDLSLWEALRRVGLEGFVASLPEGLSTVVGDEGFGFSAGQRQRLALARAALAEDTVLLLDEPTAHLDGESTTVVRDLVLDLAAHRAVIAVTHDQRLVAVAEHHLHLTPADPVHAAGLDTEAVR